MRSLVKPHWGTYNITCTSLQLPCSRLKKIAQLVPPPVIARGWSINSRIIISLAWKTVSPPAHPRAKMLCCCFYCWLDCWALKRFATENFARFTVPSSTLHPRAATSTSSRVLTSTPTTTTTFLSVSCPCASFSCWASSFWIHIRVRIAHIESCFYCRCRCRFHYINRLPRPHPSPRPGSHSPAPSSSCIDCCCCCCCCLCL